VERSGRVWANGKVLSPRVEGGEDGVRGWLSGNGLVRRR
jgi:hypothetical protein